MLALLKLKMGVLLNKIADTLGIDLGIFKQPMSLYEAGKLSEELTGVSNEFIPQTEEKNEPPQAPTLGIEDATNENIESSVNGASAMSWQEYLTKEQERAWEREDAIRKETQEREDTQFSRAAEDLRKAGYNINLLGNAPAAGSGGGITQATGKDFTPYTQEMQKYLKELEIELDQVFKGNENQKDRFTDLFSKAIQSIATYLIFKK